MAKIHPSEYLSSSPSTARLLCRGQFQDIGCVLFDCTTIPSCCSASMGKQKQTSVFEYCPFFVGFVLVVLDLRVCLQRLAAHDKKLSKKKTPNKRQKKDLGTKLTCGYAFEGLQHMTGCGGGELPLLSAEQYNTLGKDSPLSEMFC